MYQIMCTRSSTGPDIWNAPFKTSKAEAQDARAPVFPSAAWERPRAIPVQFVPKLFTPALEELQVYFHLEAFQPHLCKR